MFRVASPKSLQAILQERIYTYFTENTGMQPLQNDTNLG